MVNWKLESNAQEGLQRLPGIFGGVADDYRRRSRYFRSDFVDGLCWKTLSASVYCFIATFSSTVALGVLVQKQTSNRIGVMEYLVMNSSAGMAHALFGCQPLLVLRPTGPITAIIVMLSSLADSLDLDFFVFLAWTGIFISIWMTVVAAFELSRWITHLTRFTYEIFAFFVCSIYIHDGVSGIVDRFNVNGYENIANSLFAFILATLTFVAALWLHGAATWTSLTRNMRHFLADYAVAIAVALAIAVSYMSAPSGQRVAHTLSELVERVSVPNSIKPTCTLRFNQTGCVSEDTFNTHTYTRPWLTNLFEECTAKLLLLSAGAALPITFFFFMDQNVSSTLTQRPAMHLRKGSYYHSSFLLMAIFNGIGPLWGLPFVTGSLPHSPQLVQALWTTETGENDSEAGVLDMDALLTREPHGQEKTVARENRIAPFLAYLFIGLTLFVPQAIETIPAGCVDGILTFVGITGLFECELWERLLLFSCSPSSFPRSRRYSQVNWWRIHAYSLLQLLCLGVCWAVNVSPAGLLFSVIVVLLVPFRSFVVPLMFTEDELQKLDAPDDDLRPDEGKSVCTDRAHSGHGDA